MKRAWMAALVHSFLESYDLTREPEASEELGLTGELEKEETRRFRFW